MFDTPQAFLDFINKNGGPSQLCQIVFNNSYVRVYGDGEQFDPEADYDLETGIIKFIERDIKGREFITYKSYIYIEGLTFAPIGVNKDTINYRNYRP